MSNWILCLFVSIIFCCLDETVEAPAEKMKKPPPGDRSFFVTLAIHYKESGLKKLKRLPKSFECSGTLIDVETVVTAASCFMHRKPGKLLDSFGGILDLKKVFVYPRNFRNSENADLAGYFVEKVQFFWKPKSGPSINHEWYDVAKVILRSPTDRPPGHMFMSGKKVEPPIPLPTCGSDYWNGRELIEGSHVSIAGFSWLRYEIEDLNDVRGVFRDSWTCMEWHESEMKVSDTENMCKGIFKKETNNEKQRHSFCAVGVVKELAPEVADGSIRRMRTITHSSYTNIQENRGGPVFSTDSEGNAKCLVGVLNGIPTDDKKRYVKTKDDWFKGAIFSSVENLDSLTV